MAFDDPIRKHLPEIPQYASAVTIRHLIHHQSGMPEVVDALYLAGKGYPDLVTSGDVRALLRRWKALSFSPGERFQYSNINYIVLGWIVEQVSGQSLREFTTRRIFDPLGMTSTRFADGPAEIIRNRAVGYRVNAASGELQTVIENHAYVGHSNLWTTVEDLAIWMNNFEDGKFGGAEFISQMLESAPPVSGGEGVPYAFGLNLDRYKGLRRVHHPGGGRHRSMAAWFPDQRFSVACLCNSQNIDPRTMAMRVTDLQSAKRSECRG